MVQNEFDGGAPGGIGCGDAVKQGVQDVAGGGGAYLVQAQGGEIAAIGNNRLLGIFHGIEEDGGEICHTLIFLEGAGGDGFIDEVSDDGDNELEDGEVGSGAFLNIEDTDFDGGAGETGDGTAGVGPFGFEDAVGIKGGKGAGDALENTGVVAFFGGDPFGDHVAGDGGDAVAVVAIGFEAHIEEWGTAAFSKGRTGGERGQEGEQQANGGMQAVEFVIAAEGEVEVGGLVE